MFCKKCGTQYNEGTKFCPKCGADLRTNKVAPIATEGFRHNPKTEKGVVARFFPRTSVNNIGIVAAIILVLGTILPCVSVMSIDLNLLSYDGELKDGIFFLLFAIVGLILSILGRNLGVFISGALSTAMAIFEMISFSKYLSAYGGMVDKRVGYYFMILGSVLLLVAAPLWVKMKNK